MGQCETIEIDVGAVALGSTAEFRNGNFPFNTAPPPGFSNSAEAGSIKKIFDGGITCGRTFGKGKTLYMIARNGFPFDQYQHIIREVEDCLLEEEMEEVRTLHEKFPMVLNLANYWLNRWRRTKVILTREYGLQIEPEFDIAVPINKILQRFKQQDRAWVDTGNHVFWVHSERQQRRLLKFLKRLHPSISK